MVPGQLPQDQLRKHGACNCNTRCNENQLPVPPFPRRRVHASCSGIHVPCTVTTADPETSYRTVVKCYDDYAD